MDLVKNLTSKNKNDYESAATYILDNADVQAFKKLVEQDDFLFDFIKQNVSNRLENAVNKDNFLNLLKFLDFYSPSYDEFIAKSLAKYADEDLTDKMLELFETGSDSVKAYCAKFFSIIQDSLAIELLNKYAYSNFPPLASNCARTLCVLGDKNAFNEAIKKIESDDDFEKFAAVKFFTSYGDKSALPFIFKALRTSSMSENIATEIPYLEGVLDLLKSDYDKALVILNHIVDGLGEVSSLSQIFDFQLFEAVQFLIDNLNSKSAVVLLNAKNKFDVLTENDEYIYDEDKNTKNEIFEIKSLLYSINESVLLPLAVKELDSASDFVLTAIDLIKDENKLIKLCYSKNPTVILKAMSALKLLGKLDLINKDEILKEISDENIKAVILAL